MRSGRGSARRTSRYATDDEVFHPFQQLGSRLGEVHWEVARTAPEESKKAVAGMKIKNPRFVFVVLRGGRTAC